MKAFINWMIRIFVVAASVSTNEKTKAKLDAAIVAIDALEKEDSNKQNDNITN